MRRRPYGKRIGFVAQEVRSFDWMTVSQCFKVVAGFYDYWDADLVQRMCEQWRLSDRRISKLSPGQRQCVAILLAVGHRPDLLVLDEPMASLDPSVRRDFLKLIGELNADNGQTVILSSHICSDIERICSHVVVLHGGRTVLDEDIDELKECVRRVVGLRGGFAREHVIAQAGDRVWLRNCASTTCPRPFAWTTSCLRTCFWTSPHDRHVAVMASHGGCNRRRCRDCRLLGRARGSED